MKLHMKKKPRLRPPGQHRPPVNHLDGGPPKVTSESVRSEGEMLAGGGCGGGLSCEAVLPWRRSDGGGGLYLPASVSMEAKHAFISVSNPSSRGRYTNTLRQPLTKHTTWSHNTEE